ncbi:hypothetical protein FQN60_003880 [Etheostoma spectabile]|uniref:Meteorin-like protein n=1 Tax=Etheostoma spectabile TaxID=54343 RepID=A0A5J5CX02_9PERO|nr:hypothetical protein FQN60_003880 [Etheostoma spectabile]
MGPLCNVQLPRLLVDLRLGEKRAGQGGVRRAKSGEECRARQSTIIRSQSTASMPSSHDPSADSTADLPSMFHSVSTSANFNLLQANHVLIYMDNFACGWKQQANCSLLHFLFSYSPCLGDRSLGRAPEGSIRDRLCCEWGVTWEQSVLQSELNSELTLHFYGALSATLGATDRKKAPGEQHRADRGHMETTCSWTYGVSCQINMLTPMLASLLLPLLLLCRISFCQYSSDQCSWKGSGLTHEGHARDVEQVYLRCSQGSLEWLYPTGAIIVNLRPNTVSPAAARLSVCIKPSAHSSGTNIYLDRNGKLRLLLRDQDQAQGKVQCFSIQEGAVFIEAVPHMDISRRITAFQYELVNDRLGPLAHSQDAKYEQYQAHICFYGSLGSHIHILRHNLAQQREKERAGSRCFKDTISCPSTPPIPLVPFLIPLCSCEVVLIRVVLHVHGPERDADSALSPFLWFCFMSDIAPSNSSALSLYFHPAPCQPCSNTEMLLAVCTNDFVARGSITKVEQEEEEHSIVTVEISRLYRQKTQVFVSGGVRVRRWTGHIKMPLQCGVRFGEGEFLFTGTVRFGEAWMGCAPRYKDFLQLYHEAQDRGTNPCHVDTY